jgi:Esterase-like activity of phytase
VTGTAVAQYAYQMDTAAQGRGISALVALNDHEFLVLERNNRGLGVGATLASPDKRVYKIDITGATDVSAIDLDAGSPSYTTVTKGSTVFIDLDANTLAAIGTKSPEKWEGLAIGPQLTDGSYLILAGTDNDYSVTQNTGGTQFDVYYRFSDVDPFTTGCTGPLSSVPTDGSYKLLPGVLHAYKASQADLATFVRPVPVPASVFLFGSALGLMGVMRRKLSS